MPTDRLSLPYIEPSQAQKHVTHNEALLMLDALVQITVQDKDRESPPAQAQAGACYIVAGQGADGWSGHGQELASWQDGAWAFHVPCEGWLAWVVDEAVLHVFRDEMWTPYSNGLTHVNPVGMAGVNTTADTTNRLAVKSDGILLSHDDVTPGSGDLRAVLNKAATSNTASVLFQNQWSGRAEFGLTGDDDWHVKVSPDGSQWMEAMVVDRQTGDMSVQGLRALAAGGAKANSILFTPGGDGTISIYRVNDTCGQNPRGAIISAISGDTITLTDAVAGTLFETMMEGVVYARIWNTSLSDDQHSAWIQAKVDALSIRVRDAADLAGWSAGDSIQLGDPVSITPNRCIALDISPMLANLFGQPFRQTGMFVKSLLVPGTATDGDNLSLSPTGESGSFAIAAVHGGGDGTTLLPCTTPSPISDSNLVFVHETCAANAGVRLISCMAVLA